MHFVDVYTLFIYFFLCFCVVEKKQINGHLLFIGQSDDFCGCFADKDQCSGALRCCFDLTGGPVFFSTVIFSVFDALPGRCG